MVKQVDTRDLKRHVHIRKSMAYVSLCIFCASSIADRTHFAPPSAAIRSRCTLSITASILAGYGTPAAMAVVDGIGAMQAAGAQDKIQYPVAVGIGFLAHRILGPLLMRLAAKRVEDVLK